MLASHVTGSLISHKKNVRNLPENRPASLDVFWKSRPEVAIHRARWT